MSTINQETVNQLQQAISNTQKTFTITVGEGDTQESREFLTNRFTGLKGAKLATKVSVELVSLFPNEVNQGFNLSMFNLEAFFEMANELLTQTYTSVNGETIQCSDIDKAFKFDYQKYLMPVMMEVIDFNDFFTLLGLKSTMSQILQTLKTNLETQQVIMKTQELMSLYERSMSLEDQETLSIKIDELLNPQPIEVKKPKTKKVKQSTTSVKS